MNRILDNCLLCFCQVAMILVVEAGIFPLMCGWWIDICSFVSVKAMHTPIPFQSLCTLLNHSYNFIFLFSLFSDPLWLKYEEQAGESRQSYR